MTSNESRKVGSGDLQRGCVPVVFSLDSGELEDLQLAGAKEPIERDQIFGKIQSRDDRVDLEQCPSAVNQRRFVLDVRSIRVGFLVCSSQLSGNVVVG